MADEKTEVKKTDEEILWAQVQASIGSIREQEKHFRSMAATCAVDIASKYKCVSEDAVAAKDDLYQRFLTYDSKADALSQAIEIVRAGTR